MREAALTLAIDVDTATVVQALRGQGVEPILLKGPVLGRLLYPGELRPYCDIDLLVGPHDAARAEATLRDLGYRRGLTPLPPNLPTATPWSHPSRRSVDLHRGLHFVEAPAENLWEVVRRDATPIDVAGTPVLAPGLGVLALHLCLHAAASGDIVPKTLDDLERGLTTLPRAAWDDAMAVAAELGVVPTLGDGLGLSTAGARLAAELGLASGETKVKRLRRATTALARPWTVELLVRQPSLRTALAAIIRRCFPPPGHLRPIGRGQGPGWLALAYVARLAGIAAKLPGSLLAWGYVSWQGRPNADDRDTAAHGRGREEGASNAENSGGLRDCPDRDDRLQR